MRRFKIFMLGALCMLMLVACAQTATAPEAAETTQPAHIVPNRWGVTLKAENATPSGLTLICEQSGGENVAELMTGSQYVLQISENGQWKDVPYASQEYDVSWTLEAWLIPMNDHTTWNVNWEWLYGQLPAGEYRIGKEISNYRAPGDFDEEIIYANFVIQ